MQNSPKIKICGIKNRNEIAIINRCQPDYMGFIFANSSRQVLREEAREMKKQLSKAILSVGVFVNASLEKIVEICEDKTIDLIQLHGDEGKDFIQALRMQVPQKIIKAVRVKDRETIVKAQMNQADYLLLDTYVEHQYGGSGKTFDYELIPEKMPDYFLAGGLNSTNVKDAISLCRPYCVDVNSGVESNGMKDEVKIREIIELIRQNAE